MRKPSILAIPAGLSTGRAPRTRRVGSAIARAATTLLVAALVGRVVGDVAAEDWPQWRGPRADSTWRGAALPARWPAEGLPVAWRRPVGGGYAGPIVAEGRVLLFDRHAAQGEPPLEVERLTALDSTTGALLWSSDRTVVYGDLDYGNGPRAAPTVHQGLVYTLGALGHVDCRAADNGATRWSKDLVRDERAVVPTWGLAASPLVYEDLLLVHGGVPGGCVVAYDRLSGAERWRAGDDPAGYATPILVPREDGDLLVCWSPKHVLGFDPRSGRELWRRPYEVTYGVSIATPAVEQDVLLVCGYWEGSKAYQLGAERSAIEELWSENEFLRGLMAPPLVRDGHAYLLDKQYGLTCFEVRTGRKLWDDANRLTPRGRNPQASFVWLADEPGRILALNAEGELILARLSPAGYQEEARTRICGPTWAHFALAGDSVYVRDEAELLAVRVK